MGSLRNYYLFATLCFGVGAVIAVATGSYAALVVFLVLAAFTFWISGRVDEVREERHPRNSKAHKNDN